MKNNILSCFILSLVLVGCTRGKPVTTALRIQTPKGASSLGALAALPTAHKTCYAINVTGGGLVSTPRSCGSSLGVFAGFVAEGSVLELTVAKGSGRTIDLYAYLSPDLNSPCPALSATCEVAKNCNTYKVATVAGVDMQSETTEVTMDVIFPGLSQNEVVQDSTSNMCSSSTVTAALTVGGEILSGTFAPIGGGPSSPVIASFYRRTNATTFEIVQRSGLNSESGVVIAKPQVQSVAARAGSTALYGMLNDGTLVAMDGSGGYSSFAPGECPFTACTLPRWFKSFSIGGGANVFGIDRGGGLWRMDSESVAVLVTSLPPYVHQVLVQ